MAIALPSASLASRFLKLTCALDKSLGDGGTTHRITFPKIELLRHRRSTSAKIMASARITFSEIQPLQPH
jgi:hypothetical protein